MKKKLPILFVMYFLLSSFSVFSQVEIRGTIIDKTTKEPLIGATVFSETDKKGTATDLDGSFVLKITKVGIPIKFQYVGYLDMTVNASTDMGTIEMESKSIGLNDVVVTSSVAIRRKTPVALSVVAADQLEATLSTQEFPEVLKYTPGIYVTKQGGGYGDSRMNLRGFGSENIAVMINGVPMNEMEWGGVYWSNWSGLSDVTRSTQVQRGLGAAKVAAPSIGGSINIVTRSTDVEKGGSFAYMIGDNEEKITFSVSTGLNKNGWAMTFLGSKNWGEKYAMGTEFEAYTWFVNISKVINDQHQLSLTAFGTPQWHNQRSRNDMLTFLEWKRLGKDYIKFNPTYGFDKNGQRVNPGRNRYHKPQISLNHSWTIDEKSSLSTVAYVSIGDGGGRRWRGDNYSNLYGASNTTGLLTTAYRDPATNYMDYSIVQEENRANMNGSRNIISESINNHLWLGVLSTYTRQLTKEIELYGGLDLRYYEGIHKEKIVDLFGGDYFIDPYRANGIQGSKLTPEWKNQKLKAGDKIYRDNTAYVVQEGLFGQAEYTKNGLSAFLSASISNSTYWKRDRYYYDNQKSPTKSYIGFNLKTGANYNINSYHNVFFNAGYMSRAPFMRGGYFTSVDRSNSVNKDAVNEKSYSIEIGYGFQSRIFTANLNLYHTKWMDKTMVKSYGTNSDAFINLSGVDARHQGVELEMVFKPINNLNIKGMISIGDWIWDSKATGYLYSADGKPTSGKQNADGSYIEVPEMSDAHKAEIDIKKVKVGNSAQSNFSLGASYKCMDGLTVGADYVYFARNYADYSIEAPAAGTSVKYYSPWRIPSAGTLDLNANYKFKIGGVDATIFGNINNVLNKEYVTDAKDFTPLEKDGHTWDKVAVMYGFGRTFSVALKVNF